MNIMKLGIVLGLSVGLCACTTGSEHPKIQESTIVTDLQETPGYPKGVLEILSNEFSYENRTSTRIVVNGILELEMTNFVISSHYAMIYNFVQGAWVQESGAYTQDKIHSIKVQPDFVTMDSKFKEQLYNASDIKVLSLTSLGTTTDLEKGKAQIHYSIVAEDLVEKGYTTTSDSLMVATYDQSYGWQTTVEAGPLPDETLFRWDGTYDFIFDTIDAQESLVHMNQQVTIQLTGSILITDDGTNKIQSIKDPLSATLTIEGKMFVITPVFGDPEGFYSNVALDLRWGTGDDEVFTILRGIPVETGGVIGALFLVSHDGSIAQLAD